MDTIETARRGIELARRSLDDPTLAAYIVRDLPETKAAGLSDLAWSMARTYCTRDEAEDLLVKLEAYINQLEGELTGQGQTSAAELE